MTDQAIVAPAPLYSETPTDERGNFHYHGDLYRQGERIGDICDRLSAHLSAFLPVSRFAVRATHFTGGRKVHVELLDHPDDLSSSEFRSALLASLKDQIERFNVVRSNFYRDYLSCSFYSDVRVAPAYWVALAARRGANNRIDARVPLAAFKRAVKPGDTLTLLHSSISGRHLGDARSIIAARSGDLILEGPSYLTYPRAVGFACDGERVRIALGREDDPDAHLLYRWQRAPAD